MREFRNGTHLVEHFEDLPSLDYDTVYLDFETTSRDVSKTSLNPWHHCYLIGAAITGDKDGRKDPKSYFVPAAPILYSKTGTTWLAGVLGRARRWVNHNIKYDAHVMRNQLGLEFDGQLIDTLVLAKLVNSNLTFKGGYSLEQLSKRWLGEDISQYNAQFTPYLVKQGPNGSDIKDYGVIPIDIMAEYACMDVVTVRNLRDYIKTTTAKTEYHQKGKDSIDDLATTEIKVTKTLFDMECRGISIDLEEVHKQSVIAQFKNTVCLEELCNVIGRPFNPNSNKDLNQYLINQNGLPGNLKLTEKDNTSFDKGAMQMFLRLPQVQNNPVLKTVIELSARYKKRATLNSLFWKPWQELALDGLLHPDFNQVVSTGRMSCREPNAMQLCVEPKMAIKPREGYYLLDLDYNQVEYRLMIDAIKHKPGIEAYAKNRDVDFHQWVADNVGIDRKSAKTLNFLVGYGGGAALATDMLMGLGLKRGDARAAYHDWHRNLPGIKKYSESYSSECHQYGYVTNIYGRRKNLDKDFTRKAFNGLVQGTAADILKERLTPMHELAKSEGCFLLAAVHDSILIEVPIGKEVDFKRVMCDTREFSVPITADVGSSGVSWGDI